MSLTNPSYTVDTTFSSKNISSATSVYQFTAAASAKVQFIVELTNAAGGGDYVVYLKRQWLGAGTASVILPKTTATAAAGETVIEFVTIQINVKATDVIDVYIDGLAGDTSVNGNVRIVADNPSVFEASADTVTLANDGITAAKLAIDAITEIQSGLSTFNPTTDMVTVSAMQKDALADFFTIDTEESYSTAIPGSVVYEIGHNITNFPAGAVEYDYRVTRSDTGIPVSGVDVWVSTDNPATNIIWRGVTDTFGYARDALDNKPQLDHGIYYFWKQIAAFVDDQNPDVEVV